MSAVHPGAMPQAAGLVRISVAELVKVGPHGYTHGWIKAGVQDRMNDLMSRSKSDGVRRWISSAIDSFHGTTHDHMDDVTHNLRIAAAIARGNDQPDLAADLVSLADDIKNGTVSAVSAAAHDVNVPEPRPAVINEREVLDDYRNRMHGLISRPLSNAVKDYQAVGFVDVNNNLRSGSPLNADDDMIVRRLDRLAHMYTTPADIKLYRGAEFQLPPDPVGASFTDNGFGSSSFSEEIGEYSAGQHGQLFHITLPKGSHGIAVDVAGDSAWSEHEFLLPRGTQYTIDGVGDDNGRKVIHVTAKTL